MLNLPAVISKAAENFGEWLNRGSEDTQVYRGLDPVSGKPIYAGISNDPERRQSQHGDKYVVSPLTGESMTKNQARAVE